MMPQEAPDAESPCIRECVIDQQTGYCRGCWRTLDEISFWTSYTPGEKQRILQCLQARRNAAI
jgi:predicted Fe-S protein YdhL (DUF1289 family)